MAIPSSRPAVDAVFDKLKAKGCTTGELTAEFVKEESSFKNQAGEAIVDWFDEYFNKKVEFPEVRY